MTADKISPDQTFEAVDLESVLGGCRMLRSGRRLLQARRCLLSADCWCSRNEQRAAPVPFGVSWIPPLTGSRLSGPSVPNYTPL